MALYLRYTNNIESDVERGCSYHYTGLDRSNSESVSEIEEWLGVSGIEFNEEANQYVQVLDGLCAFELESDNLEDAIEEAKDFRFNGVYNTECMTDYAILDADYVGDCPEGDVVRVNEILFKSL